MKSSLKKLRKFAALGNDRRSQKQCSAMASDELAQTTLNMNELRDCYERLLSAAAATSNSVYEFSESLKEMGDCLLEKTALNDDEESGKVLLMLGKVQFELQKLVDGYRSHISQTITVPSESLLTEFHVVEVMKNRCDDKREIFEVLRKKHKEKRRLCNNNYEYYPSPQLQEARDEYEAEANAFAFRVKSLKNGQSRSFLTQASRHYAAQLNFFRRAVKSLEAIEPHVKFLAQQYHIDYQFSGLRDRVDEMNNDYNDYNSDEDDDTDTEDEDETQDASKTRNSMEDIFRSTIQNSFPIRKVIPAISKSAPLFPCKKLNSTERGLPLRNSPSGKLVSYVLPTPDETRTLHLSGKLSNEVPKTISPRNLRNPISEDVNKSGSGKTPPPLPEFVPFSLKKAKIQAFSGPLTGKPWPSSQNVPNSNPIPFPPFSVPLLRTPLPNSSRVSPSFVSSPKISELHQLPRPPPPRKPPHLTAHSGPLISTTHDRFSAVSVSKSSTDSSTPQILTRSYSIPGQVHAALQQHLPECDSPSATPIPVQCIQPASPPS